MAGATGKALHKSIGRFVALTSVWLCVTPALAGEADAWLARMAEAARDLSYVGTYVYHSGARMETARLMHLRDELGEIEKLETLDGPPREVLRENDTAYCYFPESRVVRVERGKARRYFPALIGEAPTTLTTNYAVQLGEQERVAGYDCRVVWLRPNDQFRFGHRLCAELRTGLLLKAAIIDQSGRPVEQAAFTSLQIGLPMKRDAFRSSYDSERAGWRTDNPAVELRDSAWEVRDIPSGFKKVLEVQRRMAGRSEPVTQLVFSDGLAAISVFIEPGKAAPQRGPQQRGIVSVYSAQIGEHQVTVLGEVPPASLAQIIKTIGPRK